MQPVPAPGGFDALRRGVRGREQHRHQPHGLSGALPHREGVGRTLRALTVGARHPPFAALHPLRAEDLQQQVVAVAEAGRCGTRGEILRRVALHEVVVQGHFALGRSEGFVGDDEETPVDEPHRAAVRPS